MDGRSLEGWTPGPDSGLSLPEIIELAFDYRGDVTIERTDGTEVTGYLFNRVEDGSGGSVQLLATASGAQVSLPYAAIANVRFTGRDAAGTGRSPGGPPRRGDPAR